MTPRIALAFVLTLSAVLGALPGEAQPVVIIDPIRLRPEGLSEDALAGFSVALAGDFAFVGAPGDTVGPPRFPEFPDMPLNRSGSVSVLQRSNGIWTQTDRLVGRYEIVNIDGDKFGWRVSALETDAGTFALVGAPRWSPGSSPREATGRAYVFRHDPATRLWAEEAALRPAIVPNYADVGSSVALAESRFGLVAVLGAPGAGGSEGRAYVFTQDPTTELWTEAATLANCFVPSQASRGVLGESVAATVTPRGVAVALAGRVWSSFETTTSAACIYSRDDTGVAPGPWTLQAALRPDPPDQNGSARVGVSAGSDPSGRATVAFGPAYGYQAHVYDRAPGSTVWTRTATLDEPGADYLGSSSAQGQIGPDGALLAGAPYDQRFGSNFGAGYLYRRSPVANDYELAAVLGSTEDLDFQYLGQAVAVSPDGWVAVTSSGRVPPDGEGRTYLYDVRSLFPVAAEAPAAPPSGRLAVAGANPAAFSAAVSYTLAEAQAVEITAVDALGRVVARVASGARGAGTHCEAFAVSSLPPGVYVVRLVAGARREAVRLVVAR